MHGLARVAALARLAATGGQHWSSLSPLSALASLSGSSNLYVAPSRVLHLGGRTPGPDAVPHQCRCFATGSTAQQTVAVSFVQHVLRQLSISASELDAVLLQPGGTTDAELVSWAQARLGAHPAQDAVAHHQQSLARLAALLAAGAPPPPPRSPLEVLLRQVAAAAEAQRIRSLSAQQLAALPEYEFVAVFVGGGGNGASSGGGGGGGGDGVVAAAPEDVRHHLISEAESRQEAGEWLSVVALPGFWQRAAAVAAAVPGLRDALQGLGFDVAAAAEAAIARDQELAAAGVDVTGTAAKLAAELRNAGGAALLLPGNELRLAAAVEAGGVAAWQLLAELRLAEFVAGQLGSDCGGGGGSCSAAERLLRLCGRREVAPPLPSALQDAFAAARLDAVAALTALPLAHLAGAALPGDAATAAGGIAGAVMAAVAGAGAAGAALASLLSAWRAAAAADGHIGVLGSMGREELRRLPESEFRALRRAVADLNVRSARLAPAAAAGVLPPALADADTAALAWAAQTGGAERARALSAGMLARMADAYHAQLEGEEAELEAVEDLAVGFELEKEVSRLNTIARPDMLMSGALDEGVQRLRRAVEGARQERAPLLGSAGGAASMPPPTQQLLAELRSYLAVDRADMPAHQAFASWRAAAEKLGQRAVQLPPALSAPLAQLLGAADEATGAGAGADAAARVRRHMQALLLLLDRELGDVGGAAGAGGVQRRSGHGSSGGGGGDGGGYWELAASGGRAVAGLEDLVGSQEAVEMLLQQSAGGIGAPAAAGGRRGERGGGGGQVQPYEVLAEVHHDMDVQSYLQTEFDPAMHLELTQPPQPWRSPALFEGEASFLDAMRPLLDAALEAQGERATHDAEWLVYRDAAIAEAAPARAAAEASQRASGRSAFNSGRADEAYLRQRLAAGLPPGSVLGAAAFKYLAAANANPSWRFSQRRHLVDRLVEIAHHLAAHPARSHRGSPFSALFQQDGPPLVPRLSRDVLRQQRRRQRALHSGGGRSKPGAQDEGVGTTAYRLPAGFPGGAGAAGAAASAGSAGA